MEKIKRQGEKMSKNKNSKRNYKLGAISFVVGLLMLVVVFGLIGYISSKNAEDKVYAFNNYPGPKGTVLEGLVLNYERDNIYCAGIVSFECIINNPKILIQTSREEVGKIEQIQISTLTSNGFKNGMYTDLNIQLKGVDLSADSNISKDMTSTGRELRKLLTPFNIGVKVYMKDYKNGDKSGDINVTYSSNILDFELSGKLDTIIVKESVVQVDKNLSVTRNAKKAVAERVFKQGVSNIIQEFNVSVKNRGINKFMYTSYKYYFDKLMTDEEKRYLNISLIGYDGIELVDNKKFTKEVSDRINALSIQFNDENMTDYFKAIDNLVSSNSGRIEINAKNKGNYTIEELQTADQMDTFTQNQNKYFEIKTKYSK